MNSVTEYVSFLEILAGSQASTDLRFPVCESPNTRQHGHSHERTGEGHPYEIMIGGKTEGGDPARSTQRAYKMFRSGGISLIKSNSQRPERLQGTRLLA